MQSEGQRRWRAGRSGDPPPPHPGRAPGVTRSPSRSIYTPRPSRPFIEQHLGAGWCDRHWGHEGIHSFIFMEHPLGCSSLQGIYCLEEETLGAKQNCTGPCPEQLRRLLQLRPLGMYLSSTSAPISFQPFSHQSYDPPPSPLQFPTFTQSFGTKQLTSRNHSVSSDLYSRFLPLGSLLP